MIAQNESRTESAIVAEDRKEVKFLGSLRKVPGLTVFEYNPKTGDLKPAVFKEAAVDTSAGYKPHQRKVRLKLIANEGCIYVQALNKKNAVKKLAAA